MVIARQVSGDRQAAQLNAVFGSAPIAWMLRKFPRHERNYVSWQVLA